jgi:hypothetical protein
MKDFIGVFDNVIPKDKCEIMIEHFERVDKNRLTLSRQDMGKEKLRQDTNQYFLSGTPAFTTPEAEINTNRDLWIFEEFKSAILKCYKEYASNYGILEYVGNHALSSSVKMQKTRPTEGYHAWHCEHGSGAPGIGNRLLLVIGYLNDVKEGGETEFLYQARRVKAKTGRMMICPSGFTHTHRGNPPLSGDKYIINTWIEYVGN